jgi:DNA-directed RNA polymerase specialized sigma24 family protein
MTKNDKKALCKHYYLLGLNATEIGKLTDYSPRTVQSIIQSENWQALRRNAAPRKVAAVWQMRNNGHKPKAIAAHFGRSVRWVHSQLAAARRLNMKANRPPESTEQCRYKSLFNYMANEHGVLLLESDMHEIQSILSTRRRNVKSV